MAMYPDLAGKVALITGAGRAKGLGEAMARRLAAEGCRVVITDIGRARGPEMPVTAVGTDEEMSKVAGSIRADGGECSAMALDVLEEDQVRAVVAANPRTVVVLMGGGAILMEAWRRAVPAILLLWY
ncbi:MAG: SDR family NAD(P)-dependent oxidoreductase, partial [Pseudomonadota bacterium]